MGGERKLFWRGGIVRVWPFSRIRSYIALSSEEEKGNRAREILGRKGLGGGPRSDEDGVPARKAHHCRNGPRAILRTSDRHGGGDWRSRKESASKEEQAQFRGEKNLRGLIGQERRRPLGRRRRGKSDNADHLTSYEDMLRIRGHEILKKGHLNQPNWEDRKCWGCTSRTRQIVIPEPHKKGMQVSEKGGNVKKRKKNIAFKPLQS